MSQVTIYLPEDLDTEVRARAAEHRQSVSAYLANLARQDSKPHGQWPEEFWQTFGAWQGDFPEPVDALPEDAEL